LISSKSIYKPCLESELEDNKAIEEEEDASIS